MDKSLIRVMLIIIFIELCVVVVAFKQNLPHWCADTQVDINQLVQPLCN